MRAFDGRASQSAAVFGGVISVAYIVVLLVVPLIVPALACNESYPSGCTVIAIAWTGLAFTALLLGIVVAALIAAGGFMAPRPRGFVVVLLFACLAVVVVAGVNLSLHQITETRY